MMCIKVILPCVFVSDHTSYRKCTTYNIFEPSEKDSQEDNCTKPSGTVRIESTQIRWFLEARERQPKMLKNKLAQGGP
jgi:hypothetical protein